MNQLILDTLYPTSCLACGKRIRSCTVAICKVCSSRISEASSTDVERIISSPELDLPSAQGLSPRSVIGEALWTYEPESPARVLQYRLKYGGNHNLAVELGRILGHKLIDGILNYHPLDCIIPIPLHRIRLRERGYNQSAGISLGLSEVIRIPMRGKAMVRAYYSGSQVGADRGERERNLHRAFAISLRKGQQLGDVLLVDDVITTGATIRSALETLYDSGAHSVIVAALFVVPSEVD
jgi:ComF family protein